MSDEVITGYSDTYESSIGSDYQLPDMTVDLPNGRGRAVLIHSQGIHVASMPRTNSEYQVCVAIVRAGDAETEAFGLFVTLAPDHARSIAASLLRTADKIDGGAKTQ